MQVGGQRRIRIPPNLGYGPQGFPGRVPPKSSVIFVVDLKEIVETPQPTVEGGSPTATP
jgi:peptidylprolyl isomerase